MGKRIKYAEITLNKLLEKLQRYCHLKGCDSYESCPEKCGYCYYNGVEDVLDLNTGCAWSVAGNIEEFIESFDEWNDAFEDFQYHRKEFVRLKNPVDRELHISGMHVELRNITTCYNTVHDHVVSTAAIQEVLSYHYRNYKSIWSQVSRTHEMMLNAQIRIENECKRCKSILTSSKLDMKRKK